MSHLSTFFLLRELIFTNEQNGLQHDSKSISPHDPWYHPIFSIFSARGEPNRALHVPRAQANKGHPLGGPSTDAKRSSSEPFIVDLSFQKNRFQRARAGSRRPHARTHKDRAPSAFGFTEKPQLSDSIRSIHSLIPTRGASGQATGWEQSIYAKTVAFKVKWHKRNSRLLNARTHLQWSSALGPYTLNISQPTALI